MSKTKMNEYARTLTYYRKIPKPVMAAIAVAFARDLDLASDSKGIEFAILKEWRALAKAGVVPQRHVPRADELRQRELDL